MRANKVMNYTSILQVLGEPGCPFCRFMKDVQAAVLQTPGRTVIHHLCNFHTWGLAAMQRAPFAAELFLTLLEEQLPGFPKASVRYLRIAVGGRRSSNSRIHQLRRPQARHRMAAVTGDSLSDSRNETQTGRVSGPGLDHPNYHGEIP